MLCFSDGQLRYVPLTATLSVQQSANGTEVSTATAHSPASDPVCQVTIGNDYRPQNHNLPDNDQLVTGVTVPAAKHLSAPTSGFVYYMSSRLLDGTRKRISERSTFVR